MELQYKPNQLHTFFSNDLTMSKISFNNPFIKQQFYRNDQTEWTFNKINIHAKKPIKCQPSPNEIMFTKTKQYSGDIRFRFISI